MYRWVLVAPLILVAVLLADARTNEARAVDITCVSGALQTYNTNQGSVQALIGVNEEAENCGAGTGGDLTAAAINDNWVLGNDVADDEMKVRYEGPRLANFKLNGTPVAVDTNTDLNNGPNTITYTDTTDMEDRTVTFTLSADGKTFAPSINSPASFTVTTVVASTGGGESGNLDNQQRTLTALTMNFQSRALADAVFNRLGNALGGEGSGPQVAENGFSASTTSVANWINQKQQQNFERQLADLPRDEDGNDIYVAPVAALFPRHQQKWSAWINANWTYYDGDGSSFDGHTLDVLAGFDYRADDDVVVGLVGGYGKTDFDTFTGGTKGEFSADGYTAGPYIGVKLSDNVQFDALAAYTYSEYDNRSGTTRGNFSADRGTVGARLKGTWEMNGFSIEPGVRVVYAEEDQNAYTDSTGVTHGSLTVKAGRVSVGPRFGYTYATHDGETIRPWVAVNGEYDFSNQGNVPKSGLPDLDDVLSARVSAGFDATTTDGLGVSIQGDISGLGSGEYTGYGATARVNVPF